MVKVQDQFNRFQDSVINVIYYILRLALSVGLGFLSAKCALFDGFSPFALILLAVSSELGLMPSLCYLSSTAGFLTGPFDLSVFKYITALTMAFVIYMIFQKSLQMIRGDSAVLTGACCFTAGFLFLLVGDLTLFSVMLLAAESILVSCCVYFVNYAAKGFRKCCYLSPHELIAACITLILLLISLHHVYIMDMSIARIFALSLLFLAMACLKTSHTAVFGSCIGIILAAVGNGGESIFTAVIVGTLVGCVFSAFSERFGLLSFILVYDAVLFFFGKFPWNYWYFSEPLIAFALIFFVPKNRLRNFLSSYIAVKMPKGSDTTEPPKNLLDACQRECSAICPKAEICYKKNASELAEALETLSERFCQTETIGNVEELLPFCIKPTAMTEMVEKRLIYSHSEDFEDLVDQLNHLSRKMELKMDAAIRSVRFLTEEESKIRTALERRHVQVKEINFILDERNCKKCDIQCTLGEDLLYEKVIEETVAPYFSNGFTIKMIQENGELFAHIKESNLFQISCSALCKTKGGEQISGDNALGFSAGNGFYYLLLADGMGSGKEASLQSELAIGMVRKLVSGGLTVPGALNVFQSAARFRQDNCFTTIDICSIDLNRGLADFYKAGAFESYHLHGEHLTTLQGGGMPLGLCENDRLRHINAKIEDGDYLIMASDGLAALGEELPATLLECQNPNVRIYANKILQRLSEKADCQYGDDVTVMICKFQKTTE